MTKDAGRLQERNWMGQRGEENTPPARAAPLERAQEGDELVLLGSGEVVEVVGHGLCFVAVPLNGVKEGVGAGVVQQLGARAHSPKRRRAQFCGCFLTAGLHDAVTRADVMQQKVAVRMNDLA